MNFKKYYIIDIIIKIKRYIRMCLSRVNGR